MLKKRLIGVITVRGGWAVQSFAYRRYLPLGRPEVVAENLDRWGADEIILQCIDRSVQQRGPDFDVLERIAKQGLSTPLIYVGGIRHAEDGVRAVQSGADRVGVDALLADAPGEVERLSSQLGAQAVLACLPLRRQAGRTLWFDYRYSQDRVLEGAMPSLLRSGVVSEAMIIDCEHEGGPGQFDASLLDNLPFGATPLIPFGGIGDEKQMATLLSRSQVVGVGVGNFLNYREHAIRHYKQRLPGLPLRHAN